MGSGGFDKYKGYTSHDALSISCASGFTMKNSMSDGSASYYYGERDLCVLDVSSDFSSITSITGAVLYKSNGESYPFPITVPFASGVDSISINTGSYTLQNVTLTTDVYFYIDGCKIMMHIGSSAYFSCNSILSTNSNSVLTIKLDDFAIGIFGYA